MENRWKTGVEPLENRRETTGKTAGKMPENRREKPRFWVTFASLNKGREGSVKASPASFSGPGGGCHRGVLPRLNVCTLRSDGVGGTGICGFLSVTEGLLGLMRAFSEFHE